MPDTPPSCSSIVCLPTSVLAVLIISLFWCTSSLNFLGLLFKSFTPLSCLRSNAVVLVGVICSLIWNRIFFAHQLNQVSVLLAPLVLCYFAVISKPGNAHIQRIIMAQSVTKESGYSLRVLIFFVVLVFRQRCHTSFATRYWCNQRFRGITYFPSSIQPTSHALWRSDRASEKRDQKKRTSLGAVRWTGDHGLWSFYANNWWRNCKLHPPLWIPLIQTFYSTFVSLFRSFSLSFSNWFLVSISLSERSFSWATWL